MVGVGVDAKTLGGRMREWFSGTGGFLGWGQS